MARIFKALSNEQRLKLFKMIYYWNQMNEGSETDSFVIGVEGSFTKACKCMEIAKSTISHHFKELQNAGLISCTRQGQTFSCIINKEIVDEIRNFLE